MADSQCPNRTEWEGTPYECISFDGHSGRCFWDKSPTAATEPKDHDDE